MGAHRFRRLHSARFQRTSAPLLQSRAPLALFPKARNSRRSGRSCAQPFVRGSPSRWRSLFQMSTERLPWIAEDPASQRLLELAQKVATAATTLLISGESGTGKDHLARLIHELGPRRDAPFLKIDCASLPP